MRQYHEAPIAVLSVVKGVAQEHHKRLDGAKIAVVMKDKSSKKAGKAVLGTASRPSEQLRPLLDDDYAFVIIIAEDEWNNMGTTQRVALVDHELCHCEYNNKGMPTMRGHDYEEFAEVFQRHGFWRKDRGEHEVQTAFAMKGIEIGTLTAKP